MNLQINLLIRQFQERSWNIKLPAGQSLQAAVVAIGAYFPGAQGVG